MKLQQQLKLKRTLRLAGWVACGLLLFLCGSVIFPPKPEENANATVGTATPATNSVKLSISGETVNLLSFNLKPVSKDGTFAESNELTITASTDSYTGYTLSIAAQSGDNTTKLINTDATNCPVTEERCYISPLPSTLSSGILKSDYIDPTSSEDSNVTLNTVRNTWGFNPSTYLNGNTQMSNRGEGVDEKYFPVSTAETNFAKTSTANLADTETGDLIPQEYTMKIGARVDTTIPMGTYQNDTFVIKAVGNGASYTINYVDSSGQANPSSMPVNQVDLTTYETTVALRTNTPTRSDGYYFAGWCSANTTTTDCNGSIYKPGDNFGIDQTSNDNTITLYAMWTDCQSGRICYDDNGANSATKMSDQTANYSDNTNAITSNMAVNLFPSNFKYDTNNDGQSDYGFAGWSEDKNAATAINATNNKPTIYGPMQNITTGDLSASGMKLYAVWVPVAKDKDGNELTFQTEGLLATQLTETAGDTLASKPNEYITALRDERDNQVYAVAKLKDGNYWMIENLRLSNYYLDSNGTVQDVSFAASNTQGLGTGANNVFVGLANPEVANFANNTTANSLYSTNGNNNTHNITYSSNDPGNLGYRMPRYRNDNTNSVTSKNNNVTVANMANTNQNVYSYGNYYSWAAAIANTMHYTSYSASDTAGTSICPSGWRLPMGGRKASVNNSDFWKLSRANIGADPANFANDYFYYTGNPEGVDASRALRSFPNNFLYSGRADDSNINGRGSGGYYWSSSAHNANRAYRLSLGSSDLYPGTDRDYKFYGFTVRCVVAPSP